jgi:hypothetical protein
MKPDKTAAEHDSRREPFGPWRQLARPAGDWTIIAQEMIEPDNARRWDVYAQHRDGARVPPGPNMHDDPSVEIVRLEALIDWPSR